MTRTELLTRLTFPEKMEQDVITNLDVQFYSDFSYTTVAFMLPEKNAVAEKMIRNQTLDQTLDQTAESSQSLVKNHGLNSSESANHTPIANEKPNLDQSLDQTQIETINLVIESIKANPNITKRQLAQIIGKPNTSTLRIVSLLISKGIIRRVGTNRKGAWLVIKDFE